MVVLTVETNEAGLITGYKVAGHAGLAEAGKDILCAAVSVLTQAPILGLERQLKRHPQYKVRDGVLTVKLDRADNDSQILLKTMVFGVEDLVREYPKYVRIEEQR